MFKQDNFWKQSHRRYKRSKKIAQKHQNAKSFSLLAGSPWSSVLFQHPGWQPVTIFSYSLHLLYNCKLQSKLNFRAGVLLMRWYLSYGLQWNFSDLITVWFKINCDPTESNLATLITLHISVQCHQTQTNVPRTESTSLLLHTFPLYTGHGNPPSETAWRLAVSVLACGELLQRSSLQCPH